MENVKYILAFCIIADTLQDGFGLIFLHVMSCHASVRFSTYTGNTLNMWQAYFQTVDLVFSCGQNVAQNLRLKNTSYIIYC